MPIHNRFADLHAEITEWRRHLHTIPELNFDLPKTAAYVEERLREIGVDSLETGVAQTGMVAVIKGKTDTCGRVIGLRADMDALPIHETAEVDYKSTHAGKMHACGHDGHTAMLLGAAQYLSETRNFDGAVAVVFQPAEEGGAGAEAMVKDGLFERFDIREIYGMHNSPLLPLGQFAIRPGAFYAAVDSFSIQVTGKGGHGARPNNTIDTTLVGSAIVMALQSIVSRNTDPQQPLVVSVTSFRTDTDAFNVIPSHATLRGTVRSFDMNVRAHTLQRIVEIADLTARSYGATAELTADELPYPVMSNHAAETEHCVAAARVVAGDCTSDAPRTTGGEDFAYMLNDCPGAYIQVGNGPSAGLHHPEYDFNDDLIPVGCSYWVTLAEQRLAVA